MERINETLSCMRALNEFSGTDPFSMAWRRELGMEDTNVSSNKNTVMVRPVKPEDAVQLRENCFSMNTLAEIEADIAERVKAFEAGTLVHLVAEVQDSEGTSGVVGTAILTRNEHPLMAHRGKVGSLVVHPDYQRRGIARRIIETMCDYAAEMGIEFLEVGCRGGTPAEKAYPRLGFIECGLFPRGLIEPWGDHLAFDHVSFYMPVDKSEGS
jgi:GNAT superfamily N-acetyltransferase